MKKKYSASTLLKISTLGIYRHAVVINDDILKFDMTVKININDIKKISYETIPVGCSWSYVYAFYLKNGIIKKLSYSKMEGEAFLQLFNDLKKINPKISIDVEILKNLHKPKQILKMNYNPPPKGQRMVMDRAFAQQHPTLDTIFGLTIVVAYIFIPWLFYFLGSSCLTFLYGSNFENYRIVMFVLSGFSVTTLLTNLFIALVSQYFGHKVTVGAGAFAILFAILGVI